MFFLYINFDFRDFNYSKGRLSDIITWSLQNKEKDKVVIVYSACKIIHDFIKLCNDLGYYQCVNLSLKDFSKIVGTKGIIDFKCYGNEENLYNTFHDFHIKKTKILYMYKNKLHTYTNELDNKISLDIAEQELLRQEKMARYNYNCCDEKYFISEEDSHLRFFKPINVEYFSFTGFRL